MRASPIREKLFCHGLSEKICAGMSSVALKTSQMWPKTIPDKSSWAGLQRTFFICLHSQRPVGRQNVSPFAIRSILSRGMGDPVPRYRKILEGNTSSWAKSHLSFIFASSQYGNNGNIFVKGFTFSHQRLVVSLGQRRETLCQGADLLGSPLPP